MGRRCAEAHQAGDKQQGFQAPKRVQGRQLRSSVIRQREGFGSRPGGNDGRIETNLNQLRGVFKLAKYVHSDVLDGGLNAIKNGAIRMLLLKAYAAGNSYATVTSNAVFTVVMASTDFVLYGVDGDDSVLTGSGESVIDTVG